MPEIFRTEFISQYHNNFLTSYFSINKTRKFTSWKYYCPSLKKDVEAYVKVCDVYLALKIVKHKLYNDMQALLVLSYQQKELSIEPEIGLVVSTN